MEKIDLRRVGAVIVAAGSSQRMNGADKILALLGGKPVIAHVIDTFQNCPAVDEIVVVLSSQNLDRCQVLISEQEWTKVKGVCPGGTRRQDSVLAGLNRLRGCEWVIIHDGARPLVTDELIDKGLQAARQTGVAVAALPVSDTIKIADENMIVRETPPRRNLWAVQTPQVFRFDIITEAYRRVTEDVTDDASLVEKLGYKVKLYQGSYDNIKITTPDDLILAETLLRKRGK